MARRSPDVALIAFDAAEPAEGGRDRIVDPAVECVDLPVAGVLVDDGAVLRARRSVVVGIGAEADRCCQPVELLAQRDVAGHQIVWRRRYGVGGGSERADAFVQMRDLKATQQHRVFRDVHPAVALQARIGLVQARKLAIGRRLCVQLQVQTVPPP